MPESPPVGVKDRLSISYVPAMFDIYDQRYSNVVQIEPRCWCCQSSSEYQAEGTTETNGSTEQQQNTVKFLEADHGYKVGFSASLPPASIADSMGNVSLNDFLSRPVKIASLTWSEGDATGVQYLYNPWTLFFNTSYIKNKLANYAWIKCDLKVKIMVNASPFYYGAALLSYEPLPNFHPSSITTGAGTEYFVAHSQRPHVWIYPQNNEGGEMTLPFLSPQNWISTLNYSNFDDMGKLWLTVATPLQQANGVSSSGVSIIMYAWAENIVLSGPSTGLTMQAKDEYGTGPVSSVASAIATAAGYLSTVPVIGKFMTATQIGATAVSSIASKFGYCNTPVIDDTMPIRPTPLPLLASTEQGYPIEKLVIDPKNELSVDPSIAGLSSNDELCVSHLAGRESYLTQFTWTTSNNTDDLLFSTAVSPIQFQIGATANPLIQMTPICWLSQMFGAWRGDIIFRFRFICTQYHRGRVRIVYDPSGDSTTNVLNTVATQSVCFNEVVDLTKDTNVEIRVPYSQALAWCKTVQPTSSSDVLYTVGSGTTFKHTPNQTNGTLALRCVTALTAPVAASTIYCFVSVRGAENFELAQPNEVYRRYSTFTPQSADEYDATVSDLLVIGNKPSTSSPERYLINYGENIISLRQILRRYMLSRIVTQISPTASALNSTYVNFYRMPRAFGFDPNGNETANGLITPASSFSFNFTPVTTLSFVSMCFIGYRGAVNWSVNVTSDTVIKHLSVSRIGGTQVTTLVNANLPYAGISESKSANFHIITNRMYNTTGNGTALTNQLTNACVNVSLPNYSRYKFNVTTPGNASVSIGKDDTSEQAARLNIVTLQTTASPFVAQMYCAAGTDWMPVFFLNVPTMWVYSADPIPV